MRAAEGGVTLAAKALRRYLDRAPTNEVRLATADTRWWGVRSPGRPDSTDAQGGISLGKPAVSTEAEAGGNPAAGFVETKTDSSRAPGSPGVAHPLRRGSGPCRGRWCVDLSSNEALAGPNAMLYRRPPPLGPSALPSARGSWGLLS